MIVSRQSPRLTDINIFLAISTFSSIFYVPIAYFLIKTISGQRSFRFRAGRRWNSLDNELKQLPFGTFKKMKEKNILVTILTREPFYRLL